ncbi:21664_t:CDS:2, partial [Gigaspora margarita]
MSLTIPGDESSFNLLDVVEIKDDGNHYLYITLNAEFDLTQLRSEKGFRINKDGSVTRAPAQALKLTLIKQYEEIYECKHEMAADCKRSLIFDVNFSVAFPEWITITTKLSRENSHHTRKQHMTYTRHLCERIVKGVLPILDKNIIVEKNFIEDVENVLDGTNSDDDKISKLCEISEKYGHFYARHLILGGTIIRNEKHTENSVENSKVKTTNVQFGVKIANILRPEVDVVHGNTDIYNNYNNNTKNCETVIGGNETEYSQDDKNPWKQSLNDETKWKIIGYEEVYSLFELLEDELKKKVLKVMGHQILEAKVAEIPFNIKRYEKNKKPYIHKLL